MSRKFNILTIILFVIIAAVAPYASAKGASLAFAQNPEECSTNYEALDEVIHFTHQITFSRAPLSSWISYPSHIALTPQAVFPELLRPPKASIFSIL